ncbi:MAG: hypothetical protein EPN75_05340 [Beijerinckiaceae bacterium]|nr:MAG: hypothetical protein EPN75_05340 [Beijerinckiaceae bacterium]
MKLIAFFALTCALGLAAPAYARTERVPKLNVESSCHAAETYGMTDPKKTYKNCMVDEDQARKTLQSKWSHYKVKTRRACLAAGQNPSPSYVELLTCIEMTEEVLHPPTGELGGGGAGTSGAVGGSPPPRPALAPGPRAMPK